MQLARRVAFAMLVCFGCVLGAARPASAAPSLTVTPSTGLISGQTVTVRGSGFLPGENLWLCVVAPPRVEEECRAAEGRVALIVPETGSFTQAVRVQRSNTRHGSKVDCAISQCVIEADRSGDAWVAASISFDPDGPLWQPDARIKNRSTGEIRFDDVFGLGLQSLRRPLQPGAVRTWSLQIQNDGTVPDDITIFSRRIVDQLTVRFFLGYYDVTAQVNRSEAPLKIADVPAGGVVTLAMQVTVRSGAALDRSSPIVVSLNSANDLTGDRLGISIRVRA